MTAGRRNAFWDNFRALPIFMITMAGLLLTAVFYDGSTAAACLYALAFPPLIFACGSVCRSCAVSLREWSLRWLCAYVIVNTLIMALSYALWRTPFDLLVPAPGCWFLLAAPAWGLFARWISRWRGALAISILLGAAAGFAAQYGELFAISRILGFLPFFLTGYLLRKNPSDSVQNIRKRIRIPAGIALLLAGGALLYLMHRLDSSLLSVSLVTMQPYTRLLDLPARIAVWSAGGLVTGGMVLLVPRTGTAVVSDLGKNTLTALTLLPVAVFAVKTAQSFFTEPLNSFRQPVLPLLFLLMVGTLVSFALGADSLSRFVRSAVLENTMQAFSPQPLQRRGLKVIRASSAILFAAVMTAGYLLTGYPPALNSSQSSAVSDQTAVQDPPAATAVPKTTPSDPAIFPVMSAEDKAQFDRAVRILFTGDIELYRSQIERAEKDGGYDFSELFEYTASYIKGADLAIGLLNGPLSGSDAAYSGDYGDDYPFGYPDNILACLGSAGYDLLSVSSSHLLDRGVEGALRTAQVLDGMGIESVGVNTDPASRQQAKILNVRGLKIAVLSYTSEIAGYTAQTFLNGESAYLTPILTDPGSTYYERVKADVLDDFAAARALQPDLIIVMPHYSRTLSTVPDPTAAAWNKIFADAGADIVLGGGSGVVQPVEKIGTTTVVNSLGNYVTSACSDDADAACMLEIYIAPESAEVVGMAAVPMWINSEQYGNYRPVPVSSLLGDDGLIDGISTYEYDRIAAVQKLVTTTVIGQDIPLSIVLDRYYWTQDGFMRPPVEALATNYAFESTLLFDRLSKAGSVCFVGDSVTEGSSNGGYGWVEPLAACFSSLTIRRAGGKFETTVSVQTIAQSIAEFGCDQYVIALGLRDLLLNTPGAGAVTSADYVSNLKKLADTIRSENPNAQITFLSPWPYWGTPPAGYSGKSDFDRAVQSFTDALKTYCAAAGHLFIDAGPSIKTVLSGLPLEKYLADSLNPGMLRGIRVYCEAALASCPTYRSPTPPGNSGGWESS